MIQLDDIISEKQLARKEWAQQVSEGDAAEHHSSTKTKTTQTLDVAKKTFKSARGHI